MHTLVNCKSSYFFRNYIMQQPDCTIFTLEMAHIDSDDTAVGSIKIIVFHIGRQVDVGTCRNGIPEHRSSGAGHQRHPPHLLPAQLGMTDRPTVEHRLNLL